MHLPFPLGKLKQQSTLTVAPTFCWALASPNPGCWVPRPTPWSPAQCLALTKFARPVGQFLRPPGREEGYTRLSVGGNKQLLWAAGIKVDSARWNPWLFLSLGPAEQQYPRATIEYSLNEFIQQQLGGQTGARRYEGGFEHSLDSHFSACRSDYS